MKLTDDNFDEDLVIARLKTLPEHLKVSIG